MEAAALRGSLVASHTARMGEVHTLLLNSPLTLGGLMRRRMDEKKKTLGRRELGTRG